LRGKKHGDRKRERKEEEKERLPRKEEFFYA